MNASGCLTKKARRFAAQRMNNHKLKILMIAPTPFFADRGCHVRIYEEARALQSLGHEVTICTYHNGREIGGTKTRRIFFVPWYRKLEAGPSFHKIYLDLFLFFAAWAAALKIKPDIIHGHLHEGAFIGSLISKLTGCPLVFDCQGSLTEEMKAHKFSGSNGLLYRFMHHIERKINHAADYIITSSTAMAGKLENQFRVPAANVIPVHDGVNTDEFFRDPDVADLREKLNLPADRSIVVYLGLLNDYQGTEYLLRSVAPVLKERPGVHFLIMGYPDVDKYRRMAEALKVAEHITFTGQIAYEEAPRYLSLGDIAVAPKVSETEANGKIYNYMACELPTVAFDIPSSREILGDLGVYAQPKDSVSLSDKILQLLRNKTLRSELSRKSREKAVKEYLWDRVAEKIMSVYGKARDRPSAVPSPGDKS